jgi:hypothetical protein
MTVFGTGRLSLEMPADKQIQSNSSRRRCLEEP